MTIRPKGYLSLFDRKIFVLQDLSVENLEARHCLEPLTSLLAKQKIRYRWQAYVTIQVIYKGIPLTVEEFGSASQMLQHMGIKVPEEFMSEELPKDRKRWQKT